MKETAVKARNQPKKVKPHLKPKQNAPPKVKKTVSDSVIDSIFKGAQEKRKQKQQSEVNKEEKRKLRLESQLKKKWKLEEQLRKANEGSLPTASKVEAGIKIYTEQELHIGKGGNTKRCPIDCDCCY